MRDNDDDESLPLQDRRKGERRDGNGAGSHNGDGRKGDRRKLIHGVAISTTQSAATLENWLQDMCMGGWSIVLDDVDPLAKAKKFRLMFEHESDKRQFLGRFAKR